MPILRRKRQDQRRVVIALADLHAGHRLGLCNPDTVLWQEDPKTQELAPWSPNLGPTQTYLWELYQEHMEQAAEFADGAPVVLLVVGDLTQGVKYLDGVWAVSVADQVEAAYWALKPWAQHDRIHIQSVRILRGTPSHTADGSTESLVADKLSRHVPDTKTLYHGLFDVDGVRFDVAHHGPSGGIRTWLRGNQLRYYLKSLMTNCLMDGQEPPDWVVRAHFHTYVQPERVNTGGRSSEIVTCPSYVGMNGHGRQATKSQYVQTHGLLCWAIGEQRVQEYKAFVKQLDLRTEESL